MSEQLQLVATGPKLTDRQTFALRLVADAGVDGVTADEVGAAWCCQRGKHPVDTRCAFDGANGRQVLDSLKKKGLVKYRRRRPDGSGGVWVAVGAAAVLAAPRGMTDRIPY